MRVQEALHGSFGHEGGGLRRRTPRAGSKPREWHPGTASGGILGWKHARNRVWVPIYAFEEIQCGIDVCCVNLLEYSIGQESPSSCFSDFETCCWSRCPASERFGRRPGGTCRERKGGGYIGEPFLFFLWGRNQGAPWGFHSASVRLTPDARKGLTIHGVAVPENPRRGGLAAFIHKPRLSRGDTFASSR